MMRGIVLPYSGGVATESRSLLCLADGKAVSAALLALQSQPFVTTCNGTLSSRLRGFCSLLLINHCYVPTPESPNFHVWYRQSFEVCEPDFERFWLY